jgi:hypothetical protein
LKICDITQYYSPYRGGVRRYVEQRQLYINLTDLHRQVLVIPDDRSDLMHRGRSVIYRVHSPRIDRICDYHAIINLECVREIIRAEQPDLIECADPYQLAWMILDESRELKIPAVAFYHSVGSNVNGKAQPPNFSTDYAPGKITTGEGATAMGFYNVLQGDAPYSKQLADNFAMSDNYHQPVMGGTGANSIMLGFGDAIWFSDENGHAGVPPHNQMTFAGGPVDEIENPNPVASTNNW